MSPSKWAWGGEPDGYVQGRSGFIAEMVDRHGFDAALLGDLLAEARLRPAIIAAMETPYEAKPWADYRRLFVTAERIAAGVRYWRDHAEVLGRAAAVYGVPAEIVVAILGVETQYGARVGAHGVLDALTTLAFSYPKRAEFFRDELESLLLLQREEGMDLGRVRGSYAGALGKPQFIPSSYRAFAVDFDGDGKRDLWGSDADVVGSVGNYLQRHGWRVGEGVAIRASLTSALGPEIQVATSKPLEPGTPPSRLHSAGVQWRDPLPEAGPVTVVRLDGEPAEYWLGLANFYAITRYNHSNLYAMAVYQLSQAIAEHYADGA